MKNKNYKKLALSTILAPLFVFFLGCEQGSPFEPVELDSEFSTHDTRNTYRSEDLQFIFLSDLTDQSVLKKEITVEELITVQSGGILELNYQWQDSIVDDYGDVQEVEAAGYAADLELDKKSKVKITFEVLPGALDEDMILSLNFADSVLAMVFGPHGLIFNQPALLNIEVKDIDLTAIGDRPVGVYYDNQETGQWELMESEETSVSIKEGKLKIKNALIPHFSRYAVAYGR